MKERLPIFIIWTLIIGDCATGLLHNLQFEFYRVGLVLKIVVILFALIYYSMFIRRKSFLSLYLAMAVLFVIWAIASSLSFFNNSNFEYVSSLVVLNRYFFFLILAALFIQASSRDDFDESCKKILDTFFFWNGLLILIGFTFNISLLSSFDPTDSYTIDRFGYKGLIFGNNEIAGIYIIGLAYLFKENLKFKAKKRFLLILTCVASILTGAKAAVIGLVLIGFYYLIKYNAKLFFIIIIPLLVGLGSMVVVYWNVVKEKYLFFLIDKFNSMDFITFMLTARNEYLIRNFKFVLSDWNPLNYLVGDAFLYTEMDFFDLYFFFGLGAIIYMYIYAKIFFIRDKSMDNFYVFIVLMALAFTGGHIIQSAVVPLFLLLYIFSANRNQAISV